MSGNKTGDCNKWFDSEVEGSVSRIFYYKLNIKRTIRKKEFASLMVFIK